MKDRDARRDIQYYKGELDRLRNYHYDLVRQHHETNNRMTLLEKYLGVEYQPASKEHPKYVKVQPK